MLTSETRHNEAIRRGQAAFARHARKRYTAGDLHIERVIRDLLAGVPGRDAEVRLIAAADLAQVLDRGAR